MHVAAFNCTNQQHIRYAAVVFILALAVTNGLLATVAVSHGARRVPPTRRQSEGVALTTALIAGIFFGSLLSLGVVFLFSGAR